MEAPRGAREPTGTNGPTPHQPPQPRHPTPQTVSAPPQGGGPGTPSPRHQKRGNTGGTGNQTPPTPRRAHKHGPNNGNKEKGGGTKKPQPLYEPRPTHPHPTHHTAGQDTPPHGGPTRGTTQACGGHSTGETPSNIPNLEAKPGRANGTAPQGVRESRKPPQHTTRGAAHTSAAPPHTPTRTQHTRPTQQANTHAITRRREEHRNDARNSAHPHATQPHKTSFPAHGG